MSDVDIWSGTEFNVASVDVSSQVNFLWMSLYSHLDDCLTSRSPQHAHLLPFCFVNVCLHDCFFLCVHTLRVRAT